MQLTKPKKIIGISLIILIGAIILLSIIYDRTALWEPKQHLITLLPKSPICYLTLKELKGLVETFNRSELGQLTSKMPLLAEIQQQPWWKQLLYQKQLWEYETGGNLDLKTITGYFGEEAILAVYQREEIYTFLLITAVGGKEKLSIEALTATDAINPTYERHQTAYRKFTINTIIGYPHTFSYTFIGKIGVLSLDPLLLAQTIDLYTETSGAKTAQNAQGFIAQHPMSENIQHDYHEKKNTGYLDLQQLAPILDNMDTNALVSQLYRLLADSDFWTFSNQYEEGVIISQHRLHKQTEPIGPVFLSVDDPKLFLAFPEPTAFATSLPLLNQMTNFFDDIDLSQFLGTTGTLLLVSSQADEVSVVPSLVLIVHAKVPEALKTVLQIVRQGKVSIAGTSMEYLEPLDYKEVAIQPLQCRLNFLLAVTGGYAFIDDYFVLGTTLMGVKSIVDTIRGDLPTLTDISFSTDARGVQAFIQPELFVPELKRLLPLATVLLSLSGQQFDATLTRRITENLFPLESLGPISAKIDFNEQFIDAEVRIVLEK